MPTFGADVEPFFCSLRERNIEKTTIINIHMNEYQVMKMKKDGTPTDVDRLYNEAYTLLTKGGDVSKVIGICNEALCVIEKSPFPSPRNNNLKSDLKSLIGFSHAESGEKDKAFEAFKESIYWTFTKNIIVNPKEWIIETNEKESHDFYSFRSVNKYLFQDLINNEVTVVSPELFNDPVDCPFFSIIKRKRSEVSYDNTPFEKAYSYFKISCFVSNLNLAGEEKEKKHVEEYKNFLMWSHYADSHRGICVKYHIKEMFLVNVEKEGIASRWIDVDYSKDEFIYKKGNNNFTIEEAFGTKANHWEYENEVRLLHYDPNCNTPFKALPLGKNGNVEAVYFGLKCPKKDIETIRGILTEDVAYFQMKEDDEDIFKLVEVPLNQKAKALLAAAVAVTENAVVE